MPRATVTVKEGKSYRYKQYTFSDVPSVITDPADIAALQQVGTLNVVVDSDGGPQSAELKPSVVEAPQGPTSLPPYASLHTAAEVAAARPPHHVPGSMDVPVTADDRNVLINENAKHDPGVPVAAANARAEGAQQGKVQAAALAANPHPLNPDGTLMTDAQRAAHADTARSEGMPTHSAHGTEGDGEPDDGPVSAGGKGKAGATSKSKK